MDWASHIGSDGHGLRTWWIRYGSTRSALHRDDSKHEVCGSIGRVFWSTPKWSHDRWNPSISNTNRSSLPELTKSWRKSIRIHGTLAARFMGAWHPFCQWSLSGGIALIEFTKNLHLEWGELCYEKNPTYPSARGPRWAGATVQIDDWSWRRHTYRVSRNRGAPRWMVFCIMELPLKMHDFGVYFRTPPYVSSRHCTTRMDHNGCLTFGVWK